MKALRLLLAACGLMTSSGVHAVDGFHVIITDITTLSVWDTTTNIQGISASLWEVSGGSATPAHWQFRFAKGSGIVAAVRGTEDCLALVVDLARSDQNPWTSRVRYSLEMWGQGTITTFSPINHRFDVNAISICNLIKTYQ